MDTFTADTFTALNDPDVFAQKMAYLGHFGIDTERYRLDIRAKVQAEGIVAPASSLGKYIVSYLTRELESGPLRPAPTPAARLMPDNPCSLWGELNPAYDHRNYPPVAGQFTGTVQ